MIFSPGPLMAIGLIRKTHGFNGGLKVEKYSDTTLKNQESVFIHMDGKPVPFFLSDVSESQDSAILFIQGAADQDSAKKFCGKEILIPSQEAQLEEISFVGYQCRTPEGNHIGTIAEILEYPHQIMLHFTEHNEIIPLVDDFIEDLNHTTRSITLNLPEGLLNLNHG